VTQPRGKVKNMTLFRLPALEAVNGLTCAWVARGPVARPDPAGLLPLLWHGASPPPLATVSQIHSSRWLRARAPLGASHVVLGEADAILTSEPGVAVGIATADCVPIVAVDAQARALAVVHAGWRGTLAGILRESLAAMKRDLGALPERIVVGIGPAVGACCYRVGEDVAASFAAARPGTTGVVLRRDGAPHLDLIEENRLQAKEEGVSLRSVHALDVCTVCRADLCHSYRRDGPQAGRMWLLAALE
jgi:polyphenol oxidase